MSRYHVIHCLIDHHETGMMSQFLASGLHKCQLPSMLIIQDVMLQSMAVLEAAADLVVAVPHKCCQVDTLVRTWAGAHTRLFKNLKASK